VREVSRPSGPRGSGDLSCPPMTPIVDVRALTKDYGRVRVLHGITLRIGPGITGLLGPNGAGKSTLIKALLGLVRVTSGEGEVLGHELGKEVREIRSRIGFMPEDDCVIPGLTGIDTVAFSARLWGMEKREALRRSHEILDFSDVGEERYRPTEQYSTGMKQKLKFAQALVHDPDLLILDEPTSGLDPEQRPGMLNRIRFLAEKVGKAVIISTHILPDVQATCDEVIILAHGRVRLQERLETLQRPVTPSLTLRLFEGAEGMASRLESEGVPVTRLSAERLRGDSEAPGLVDRIWRAARESGAVVGGLEPARNSLEEIFLETVREDSNAGS
jgi:ABC-2 type transport system ATP-binding protein